MGYGALGVVRQILDSLELEMRLRPLPLAGTSLV
jgi:hypothetical protein